MKEEYQGPLRHARIGVTGAPTLEPGLGLGLCRRRLVAGLCPRDPAGLSPKWREPAFQ
ncbi:hypothetical protein L3Q82_022652 [Scortum barcoo]|uniref:Uncharacterized protein n=1 Tax=Scortum barcoo TaxID=214431 RepID=A0ACB8WWK0_9TELE|nr:hypothetical protein L3Q82_022652 [Scortum barcoo]